MTLTARAALLVFASIANPTLAFTLTLPEDAVLTADVQDSTAEYGVATGPSGFGEDAPQETLFGDRRRTSWRIADAASNSAVLLRALRQQVEDGRAEVLFSCSGKACGGFDFRAGRPTLPMPDMFVDLERYNFLSARLPAESEDDVPGLVSILASESPGALHLQVTRIDAPGATPGLPGRETTQPSAPTADGTPEPTVAQTVQIAPAAPGTVSALLQSDGYATLDGLAFDSGTATLTSEEVPVLAALATYLIEDPARRIALVGHSDWTGDPGANRRLSEARAATVSRVLVDRFSVPRRQIEVFGAGDLTPRTTNATEEGRNLNRRVDAVARPPFGG